MVARTFAAAILLSLVIGGAPLGAHERFRFVGTVVKMDVAKKMLKMRTIENKKELLLNVPVDDKTPIERDGKKASRSDLKPGVNIVLDAFGDDYETMDATLIKIVPPPTK